MLLRDIQQPRANIQTCHFHAQMRIRIHSTKVRGITVPLHLYFFHVWKPAFWNVVFIKIQKIYPSPTNQSFFDLHKSGNFIGITTSAIVRSRIISALSLTETSISVFLSVYMECSLKKLYMFFNYLYLNVLEIKYTKNSYIVSLMSEMVRQYDQFLKKQTPPNSWCCMPHLFLCEKKYFTF